MCYLMVRIHSEKEAKSRIKEERKKKYLFQHREIGNIVNDNVMVKSDHVQGTIRRYRF